jgi:GNAT superfamily N-acetyltransferase
VSLDAVAVLSEYDAQVRRGLRSDGSGALGEWAGPVVRWSTVRGEGWCGISWSDLDAGTADAAIAEQVAYFAGRGEQFEWKLYSYDRPPDLGERLAAAGFAAQDAEALVVADASEIAARSGADGVPPDGVPPDGVPPDGVPPDGVPPDGVRLVPVTDEAGIELMIEVHDRVFGSDPSLRGRLLAQLRNSPEFNVLALAMAGDTPVCAARVSFGPTDFAGLWGGGTLPEWRGRGIYRAMVGYRARLAAERGCRYLQVDASPMSRPILERLGFACLAMTTPYVWSPGANAPSPPGLAG